MLFAVSICVTDHDKCKKKEKNDPADKDRKNKANLWMDNLNGGGVVLDIWGIQKYIYIQILQYTNSFK